MAFKLHPIRRARRVKLVVAERHSHPLKLDKRSYLLVKIDYAKGELAVGRCTPGHVLTHEFRGKGAKSLCKAVVASGLMTRLDHAAYLGRELQRAEICLKNRKMRYVQDAA